MSKIVVGWQLNHDLEDADVRSRIDRIKARYQPLFQETIEHTGFWRPNQGLLHFDVLPQPSDPGVWANDGSLICVTGNPTITAEESPLYGNALHAKALAAHLIDSSGVVDRRALRTINPPFTVCSYDTRSRLLHVVHDGLGMDQFFVGSNSQGVVVSNKCWPILLFLNESLRIDSDAWRQWFCLGWMPGNATPFENIRYLERGEIIRADSRTVAFDSDDPIREWMSRAEGQNTDALMQRASQSVGEIVRWHKPATGPYPADLTGGRDSRAICAILIKEGIPSTYCTGGLRQSADVMLAKRIAKRFDLAWQHLDEPTFGRPRSAALLETLFSKLVLWGEGLVEANRFSHFGPEPSPTEHGAYLSGGQGEISKCHYDAGIARRYPAAAPDFDTAPMPVERQIRQLLHDHDGVRMTARFRDYVAAGETYGIAGWPLLDFFHVTHKVRRWQSSHLAVNLFDRTVLPFVNIDHIRLAFALNPPDKANRTFQTFIVRQNVPALLDIPFADVYRVPRRLGRFWKTPTWSDYLRRDGRALVESLFSSQPVLWEILDQHKIRTLWNRFLGGSDEDTLVILGLLSFRHWYEMFVDRLEPIQHHVG